MWLPSRRTLLMSWRRCLCACSSWPGVFSSAHHRQADHRLCHGHLWLLLHCCAVPRCHLPGQGKLRQGCLPASACWPTIWPMPSCCITLPYQGAPFWMKIRCMLYQGAAKSLGCHELPQPVMSCRVASNAGILQCRKCSGAMLKGISAMLKCDFRRAGAEEGGAAVCQAAATDGVRVGHPHRGGDPAGARLAAAALLPGSPRHRGCRPGAAHRGCCHGAPPLCPPVRLHTSEQSVWELLAHHCQVLSQRVKNVSGKTHP